LSLTRIVRLRKISLVRETIKRYAVAAAFPQIAINYGMNPAVKSLYKKRNSVSYISLDVHQSRIRRVPEGGKKFLFLRGDNFGGQTDVRNIRSMDCRTWRGARINQDFSSKRLRLCLWPATFPSSSVDGPIRWRLFRGNPQSR